MLDTDCNSGCCSKLTFSCEMNCSNSDYLILYLLVGLLSLVLLLIAAFSLRSRCKSVRAESGTSDSNSVRAGETEDALLVEKPAKNHLQDELADFLANESVLEAEEETPLRINFT
jgi:hypothetical protein